MCSLFSSCGSDIQDNRITGRIPEELGLLNNLEHLWLQQNNLTGTIPSIVGSLGNLLSLCVLGAALARLGAPD